MKPEEILPDVSNEAVIRMGDDDRCLTLAQFKKIILEAAKSMKINYVESIRRQGYRDFVADIGNNDRLTVDGTLISHDDLPYKDQETGELFTISDFQWFNSGEDCKILQPGEKWQNGAFRIRVTTEFIPKESSVDRPIEPSLDTFRESP